MADLTANLQRHLLALRAALGQLGQIIGRDWSHPATWGQAGAWAWRHDRAAVELLGILLTISIPLLVWAVRRLIRGVVLAAHRIAQGAGPCRNPRHIFLGEGDGRLESYQDEEGRRRLRLPANEVYIPVEQESSHTLIAGSSGSGKTQLFYQIANALNVRRGAGEDARALVLDLKGDFIQHYHHDGDALFNPMDARCVGWNLFAELRPSSRLIQSDLAALGAAFIPDRPGDGAFWNTAARNALTDIIQGLYLTREDPTNGDLVGILSRGDWREIRQLLAAVPDSQARAYFEAGQDDRATRSIWTTLTTYAVPLRLLDPSIPKSKGFSFRRWGAEGKPGQWLFLARRVEDEALLGSLYATIISLVATGQMSVRDERARPVHYLLDELAQAGTVSGLERLLTFGRSKKAAAVIGIQSAPQLVKRYGRETSATILGNAGTLAVLRQGDRESAELFADLLGKKRGWRNVTSHNTSAGRKSSGTTRQRYEEHIYTPTNLLNLRALSRRDAGEGLVRITSRAGKHPRPRPIRVVYMRDRIPAERVPDFIQGGEGISWTPEAVRMRSRKALDAQARDSDREAWARMERNAKAAREGVPGSQMNSDDIDNVNL